MLQGHLMIRTENGSLEKTPNVLKSVCMNDAAHVFFLPVCNRRVKRVFVGNTLVAFGFVRHYERSIVSKFRFNERMKYFAAWRLPAYLKSYIAAAFNCAQYHRFVF